MEPIMGRADQVTGIVVLVFSLAVMEGARRLPPSGTFGPGPGFLPFWLGAVLAMLAVLLMVGGWRRRIPGGRLFPRPAALVPVGLTLGGLAAYIFLMERLGFLLATGLLAAFLLGVVERERWWVALGIGALNALALYVIFYRLLGVSLPRNALGF
jgi:putative tricarboxylic transport membrane protein